jgi:hypothetical protein
LIGTPPNIVIATFRGEALGDPYTMFDFAPVGLVVAAVGIAYVALIGWRLIPVERTSASMPSSIEDLESYLVELRVPAEAEVVGQQLRLLDTQADEAGVQILGLIRDGERLPGMAARATLQAEDRIVVEGGPDGIEAFAGTVALSYADSDRPSKALIGHDCDARGGGAANLADGGPHRGRYAAALPSRRHSFGHFPQRRAPA